MSNTIGSKVQCSNWNNQAAVDENCTPIDFQIGSTISIITPKLYITSDISEPFHHMAGIEDTQTIVDVTIMKCTYYVYG